MAYTVPNRIYRTTDGRLVHHGDPEAAFLAFPEGEELSDEEATRFGLLALEKKQHDQPENKLGARPTDKSAALTEAPKEGSKESHDREAAAPEGRREARGDGRGRPGRDPGRVR